MLVFLLWSLTFLGCHARNSLPVSKQAAPIAISSSATSALEPCSHTAVTFTWNLEQSTYHWCIKWIIVFELKWKETFNLCTTTTYNNFKMITNSLNESSNYPLSHHQLFILKSKYHRSWKDGLFLNANEDKEVGTVEWSRLPLYATDPAWIFCSSTSVLHNLHYPLVSILHTHDVGQSAAGQHPPSRLSTDHFSPRPVVRWWSHSPL